MLSTLLAVVLSSSAAPYVEPGGAFAFSVPAGWTVNRQVIEEGTILHQSHKQGNDSGPHVDVMLQKLPSDLPADIKGQMNQILLDAFLEGVKDQLSISKQTKSATTFDSKPSVKADLEFTDDKRVPHLGTIYAVTGRSATLLVMYYAPASDRAGLKLAMDHAMTLAVDSRVPRAMGGAQAGGGPLSQAALTTIAGRVRANFKREAADTVVSPGDPPLTYGSIASFVNVIEILFDIQLTEAEFDATRERCIEFYGKADADGRRILALQGASLLATLTTGTPEEIAQSRAEGKAVFTNAFKNGAEQGIGYAVVMWNAISRRQSSLGTAKTTPSRDGWDAQITEGDLDATMEMLYFMWVGAGRDAGDVTLEDVLRIRAQIVEGLPTMDPQLQLLIANAPRVYAGLRQQWQAAGPPQRLVMAQQFGAALDEWGIGAQSGFDQSNGGGGGSEYSMNAQIAQNTAWNAAKTW